MENNNEEWEKEWKKILTGLPITKGLQPIYQQVFTNLTFLAFQEIEKAYQKGREKGLEEVEKVIKEKGLHLGYGNEILQQLNKLKEI